MKKLFAVLLLVASVCPAFTQTPDWAKDRKADYEQIVELVKSTLVKDGLGPVTAGKEAGMLSFTMDGTSYQMNLYSIFTTCKGADKKNWPALVNDFVGKVRVAQREARDALASLESWSTGKDRLFVKVYPLGYESLRGGYVGFEEIPGTLSVVVVDFPSSVDILNPTFLKKWNKEAGEVFLAAKANTLASLKAQKIKTSDLGNGQTLSYYHDESNIYIASLALDRDLLKAYDGSFGAFLSVPSRSVFLIQPLKDAKYIHSLALNVLLNAVDFYKKASGPISPDICWYHQGKYYPVIVDTSGTQNKMEFPEELKTLMKQS
jgi:hypothetical protein